MSKILFVPKHGTSYENGWPTHLIGDGFIELRLLDSSFTEPSAVYVDNSREEYEVWGRQLGKWWIDI